jgi:tetratricopeptide (TPR) repeat protein
LAYAHAQRTVHRDIKPANILVSTDQEVKLADFGLAQVLGTNSYAGGAGTYAYMAPEDFNEGDRSDRQSDLWAVGVILYEMLTGRRPFTVVNAKDPFGWSRAIAKEEIKPPSSYVTGIPPALDAICLKALQRDKLLRYHEAKLMADDLRRLYDFERPDAIKRRPRPDSSANNGTHTAAEMTLMDADEIDSLLLVAPTRWEEFGERLIDGALAAWLERIGEPLLAQVAHELQRGTAETLDSRIRDFLYRAGMDLDSEARNHARKGSDLIGERQYPGAVEILQRALHLDPTRPSYYRLLAQAARGAGDLDLARETLETALERYPNDRSLRRDIAVIGGARPHISAEYIDFGTLHHGEHRMTQFTLRGQGADPVKGRISVAPAWLSVTPLTFNSRSRQVIKLECDTSLLPDDGVEYDDHVLIETSAGVIELPISIAVVPKRPLFGAILHWYLPIFVCCLLPFCVGEVVAVAGFGRAQIELVGPAGLIASGTLFASFLAVNIVVDTRLRERMIPGLGMLLLPLGIYQLLSVSSRSASAMAGAWPVTLETILPCVAIPLLQAIALVRSKETFTHWQLWSAAIAIVAIAVSIVLWFSVAL